MKRDDRLVPRWGPLFVVRWVRADGQRIRHRYYRRQHDALVFLERLKADGREVALFSTRTDWWEHEC